MEIVAEQNVQPFVDRRGSGNSRSATHERRQFSATASARPEVRELATAVDNYKVERHRRFITYEELFDVMIGLGYHK